MPGEDVKEDAVKGSAGASKPDQEGSTAGRLLLPERGALPVSPRIEGVDPPARKQRRRRRAPQTQG